MLPGISSKSIWILTFLGLVWAVAAQQAEKPAEHPPEKPPLQNTGKPMVVEFHCAPEDLRSAGLSCTVEDPCPVFLELDGVEAVGNRIFLVGNIHTATTTLYSILLASDDTGKTWHEPFERLRAAGLDHVQFIDFENGWISGETLHPLPRDPFLLATSDGGQTWRSQPVFAEPQFGFIVQFAFNSRSSGTMVIDRGHGGESGRYELYETPNAGETWMLRQSSEKLIPMKHSSGAENADWRLRPDAATKAYRVERHVGGQWRAIASFAVSLGVCKPLEMPLASALPAL
jgi:hypothetical protein